MHFTTTIVPRSTGLLTVYILFALACCPQAEVVSAQEINPKTVQSISAETTSGLHAFFRALDYRWMTFKNGVPPIILDKIPEDINYSVNTKTKKQTFFMALLPMILLANQEISQERSEIKQILKRHETRDASADDRKRITAIAKRYGLRGRPLTDHRARRQLLKRVDTIPPSLVLAQAANESAWGTSRFAQQGNNLFGEWTFKPGTGIVPAGRPDGEIYEVRVFNSIYQSIRSYMNNLNTHSAYRQLREIREDLRKRKKPVTGIALSAGLASYSERGEEYIKEINEMIRHNNLGKTNLAKLRQAQQEALSHISSNGSGLFSTRNRLIGHTHAFRYDP
jgi:Bax protein